MMNRIRIGPVKVVADRPLTSLSAVTPRAVIAAPLFEQAEHLGQAVESLLAQTCEDFALLLVDDCSTDDTVAVARRYEAADPRVRVLVNERRLGMLGNTNRCYELARELHPAAPYFALASDHDVWEPAWLESMLAVLDASPDVVLAYPQTQRIEADGAVVVRGPWEFDTATVTAPRERARAVFRRMVAGDMVYGLFRVSALDEIGLYQPVLVPDRLMLTELALRGRFVQVPQVLWSRRFRGLASLKRQRNAFFLDGAPWYSHRPWWVVHVAAMFRRYVLLGAGRPRFSRAAGVLLTLDYAYVSARHRLWRRSRRARKRWARRRRRAIRAAWAGAARVRAKLG